MSPLLQKLAALIQASFSLSSGDKERLLDALPSLKTEDLRELEKTLMYEHDRCAKSQDEKVKKIDFLNAEYERIMRDFYFKKIPLLINVYEQKDHSRDEGQADQLLQSL